MTGETELLPMPAPSGDVIEVVPRGTRPLGDAGEGGAAPEQQNGPAATEPSGGAPAVGGGSGRRTRPAGGAPETAAPPAEAPAGAVPDLPLPPVDETYQNYRADRADQAAVGEVRRRVETRRRGSASGAQRVNEDAPDEGMFDQQTAEPEPIPPSRDTAAVRMLRGAGRVMRNVAEIPGQIVTGALNATREVFRAGDDLANWLNENVADLTVSVPLPGVPRDQTVNLNPTRVMADAIPEGPQAHTVTGEVTREGTQFLVGFLRGTGLLSRLGVAQGAGRASMAARGVTAGAISDFFFQEADEANLSRAWRDAGLPENALTDFLATDPTDNAALNRLRRAVEGSVTGAALDGLIAAVRAARAGLAARRAQQAVNAPPARPQPEPQSIAEAGGVAPNAARDEILSPDASRPLVEVRLAEAAEGTDRVASPVTAAQLEYAGQAGSRPTPNVFINWGRINTPDDVQAAMRDMAEAFQGEIDAARRGVQTNEETARLASQLGMTVEDLLSRQHGQPWNAETALAARRLYTASGERLLQAAQAAAAPGSGALEAMAFRRMMAVHAAIQAQVIGARTETARALQAWAIPAGSAREQMRAIEQLLEGGTGVETAQQMARRMAALAQALPPEEALAAAGQFARRGWGAASIEAIQEVWINALLSSPSTHLANITGNGVLLFLSAVERQGAAGVSALRASAPGEGIMPGEAAAMLYGVSTGIRDAFRLMARSYADGGTELGMLIGKAEMPRDPAISARNFGVDGGSGLGRAMDFIGHQVVRAPGRAMGAEDAFFKSLNYRMELHAASLREAYSRLASRGEAATVESIGAEMGRIMRDPPEHIRIQAADFALYNTFNREAGPWARRLMGLRNTESAAANLAVATVLPFVRTPANILSYSFERTPFAPLVGQWRADVAAGGARRDLALGRMATGSAMMLMAMDMASRGMITGGGADDPNERAFQQRAGRQPYSVRVGDAWVSLNRLDPFGFILGAAADLHELTARADIEPEEVNEVSEIMAALTLSVSRMVADRSWMTGVSRAIQAIDGRNPNAETFIAGTLSSLLVPGAVATARRIADPVTRDAMGMQDAIQNRIAGLSQRLIPRRNLWGEQERPGLRSIAGSETAAAAFNAVTPARVGVPNARPIDREMERLNLGIGGIERRQSLSGVEVNLRDFPQALDRLRQLAGNALRRPEYGNLGLRDALNEMVQGRGPQGERYQAAPDFGRDSKAAMIRGVAEVYRSHARDQVLAEFPDLRRLVDARRGESGPRNTRGARMPGATLQIIPVRPRRPLPASEVDAYDGPFPLPEMR